MNRLKELKRERTRRELDNNRSQGVVYSWTLLIVIGTAAWNLRTWFNIPDDSLKSFLKIAWDHSPISAAIFFIGLFLIAAAQVVSDLILDKKIQWEEWKLKIKQKFQ